MNKFSVLVLLVVVSAALTGCVTQEPGLLKPTTSGYPEETLAGTSVEQVKARIMDVCASRGVLVQETGSNHVVCGRTMTGGDAVLAQFLIGNSYSTTPERKVRFTIIQMGQNVRVTAQQWIETQMAFGQMRRTELNGNAQRNDIQRMLMSLGQPVDYVPTTSAFSIPTSMPSAGPVASSPEAGISVPVTQGSGVMQPLSTAQPTSAPAGQDSRNVERIAKSQACHGDPKARLTAKGPGFETYAVACSNGDSWTYRCEFGNCRKLQ